MQGMLGNYLEQSAKMFMDMQQRMQDQTRGLFTAFPFPNFGAPRTGRARRRQKALIARLQARAISALQRARFPQRTIAPMSPSPLRARPRACPAAAPRVGFVSLGCPKALVDSERILTQLRAEGYAIAPSYDGADLVVVNTCGFIDAAVEESLSTRSARRWRKTARSSSPAASAPRKAGPSSAAHPKVLAVTGPHAAAEVMAAVHEHLPKPHDPFVDLVPAARASSSRPGTTRI